MSVRLCLQLLEVDILELLSFYGEVREEKWQSLIYIILSLNDNNVSTEKRSSMSDEDEPEQMTVKEDDKYLWGEKKKGPARVLCCGRSTISSKFN